MISLDIFTSGNLKCLTHFLAVNIIHTHSPLQRPTALHSIVHNRRCGFDGAPLLLLLKNLYFCQVNLSKCFSSNPRDRLGTENFVLLCQLCEKIKRATVAFCNPALLILIIVLILYLKLNNLRLHFFAYRKLPRQ